MSTQPWLIPDPNYFPVIPIGDMSSGGLSQTSIPWPTPWVITDVIETADGYVYKAKIEGNTREILGAFGARKYVFDSEELDKYSNNWVAGQTLPAMKVGDTWTVQQVIFKLDGCYRDETRENAFVSELIIEIGDRFSDLLNEKNESINLLNLRVTVLSKGIDEYAREIGLIP